MPCCLRVEIWFDLYPKPSRAHTWTIRGKKRISWSPVKGKNEQDIAKSSGHSRQHENLQKFARSFSGGVFCPS